MDRQISDAVLDVLQPRWAEERLIGHPVSEVVDTVHDQLRVSKAAVKAAIWVLYGDGFLELTPDWDLRATGQQERTEAAIA